MRGVFSAVEASLPSTPHDHSHAAAPAASLDASAVISASQTPANDLLPDEIGFLADFGAPRDILLAVAAQARDDGAPPDAVLLREGLVDEAIFYRILARHCGVDFVDTPVQLVSTARFPQSVHAGIVEIVPVSGARWLMAPSGRAIGRLIALARRSVNPRHDFAIATPTHLSRLVETYCEAQRLDEASFALVKAYPAMCAFHPRANHKAMMALASVLLVIAGSAVSPALATLITMTCGLMFFLAIFARLCALMASYPATEPVAARLEDRALPVYTIIVPLYREAEVVPDLVINLDNIDYPPAKLDIKLVVEASDTETRKAIEALRLPAKYQMVVAPDGKPRTKPRALNIALPLARGALTVVFDAEDRPDPQQLRRAAEKFAATPGLACLQAQLAIENACDSWLTRMFAIEYAALFDVINPGIGRLGLPLPLGGTSNHFRTSVLRDIGGWDPWNVTEDADLGVRLARLGFRVECFISSTFEEAPITLGAWLGQRRRWQKGWLQTIGTHFSSPRAFFRDLGPFRGIMAAGQLMGLALGTLTGPLFAFAFWRSMMMDHLLEPETMGEIAISTFASFVFLAGLVSLVVPVFIGMHRRNLLSQMGWLVLLPAYQMLALIATWHGFWELCRRPFHWQKTVHGLSKSRPAPGTCVPAPVRSQTG